MNSYNYIGYLQQKRNKNIHGKLYDIMFLFCATNEKKRKENSVYQEIKNAKKDKLNKVKYLLF